MSKPLLTDDVIEQAKRGEIDLEEQDVYKRQTLSGRTKKLV